MFLLRLITWLISLPLLWAGMLLATLKVPLCVPLLRGAWRISGDGDIGSRAIGAVQAHAGLNVALAEATHAMDHRPSPQVAGLAGLLAIQNQDRELAKDMLARGRELGDDPAGSLDMLEFFTSMEDPKTHEELVARLDSRHDLPPMLSIMASMSLASYDVYAGRFDDVRLRAGRILAVRDWPVAQMLMWTVETQAGNHAAADAHRAKAQMPPEQKASCQIVGYAAMGDFAQTRQLLEQLRGSHPETAEAVEERLRNRVEGWA